jgi:hypothetical protein
MKSRSIRLLLAAMLLTGCTTMGSGPVLPPPAPMTALQRAKAYGLIGLKGMDYEPAPSDYSTAGGPPSSNKYWDTDFANFDFKMLWSECGRNDLGTMASQGINFIKLYNWSSTNGLGPNGGCRQHIPFLDDALLHGMKVGVPLSNFILASIGQPVPSYCKSFNPAFTPNDAAECFIWGIMDEIYDGRTTPHPAVGALILGNEFDDNFASCVEAFKPEQVATLAQYVGAWEDNNKIADADRLPLTSPVTDGWGYPYISKSPSNYAPGVGQLTALQSAFTTGGFASAYQCISYTVQGNPYLNQNNVFANRFIAAVNPFQQVAQLVTYLTSNGGGASGGYLQFSSATTTPLFFGELSLNSTSITISCTNNQSYSSQLGQAVGVLADLQYTVPLSTNGGTFIGSTFFTWLGANYKGADAGYGQATYANDQTGSGPAPPCIYSGPVITTGYTTTGNSCHPICTYPVDTLQFKCVFDALTQGFSGTAASQCSQGALPSCPQTQ